MVETPRLLLRRPTEEDNLIISNLWRNDVVRTFLGGILSDEKIHEKIRTLQNHWEQYQFGLWSVLDKNNQNVIGVCGPHYSEDENIEISYMFFPQFWGNGFAKESVRASIEYCFKLLNIEAIIAITQEANRSSCRLLESAGMRLLNNFERFDAVQCTYGITKGEWQQDHSKTL